MKNRPMSSSIGVLTAVFAVVLIVLLPLRTMQYYNDIEGGTGFYKEINPAVILSLALLAVGVIACIAVAFISRKAMKLSFVKEKNIGCGAFSAFLALGAAVDGLTCLNHVLNLGLSFLPVPQYPDFLPSSETVMRLEAIFAFISAVFFILCAVEFFSGRSCGEKLRLLSLSPVVWSVLRIVYRFTITISYIRVSQLALEMFMLIFFVLFFMAYAQVNSKVNAKGLDWKIAGYGFPAVLLGLLSFVPQAIIFIGGRSDLLYIYSVPCLCDAAAALFILAVILTRLNIGSEVDETIEIPADASIPADEAESDGSTEAAEQEEEAE